MKNPTNVKWVPGLRGRYLVSECGKVFKVANSDPAGYKQLATYKTPSGPVCCVSGANVLVRRIVAQTFVPNPEGLKYVLPIDGDKYNCRASNLTWSPFTLPAGPKPATLSLEDQVRPASFAKDPTPQEMVAWLPDIRHWVDSNRTVKLGDSAKKTLHKRIAHLSTKVGMRMLNGWSPAEDLELMLAKAVEHLADGDWESAAEEAGETGSLYVLCQSTGWIKVGRTKAGRLWGKAGRLREHKRAALRHGTEIVAPAFTVDDVAPVAKIENDIHAALKIMAPRHQGETYQGLTFEKVVGVVESVLDKHTYGDWSGKFLGEAELGVA